MSAVDQGAFGRVLSIVGLPELRDLELDWRTVIDDCHHTRRQLHEEAAELLAQTTTRANAPASIDGSSA